MMITTQPLSPLETHRRELHAHAIVLTQVWSQIPAGWLLLLLLVAPPGRVEDVCSVLLEMLSMVQTVAEAAAAYVEPRPLLVSARCRLAPSQVEAAIEDTSRSLVLLRDTCRSMPCPTVREREHAVQQMHDLRTLVRRTIAILETEARTPEPERSHPCL